MKIHTGLLPLPYRFDFRGQSVAWGKLGDGPPVLLVHGFPWSSQAWRKIAPWLAQDHSVYYFDMIGCGQSARAEGQDVSEPVQSELIAALVDHWRIERPTAIGHDFGGLAVLRAHFIGGVSYKSMHLIDSVAVLPSGSSFYAHVAEHESAFAGLPAYAHEALFHAYVQKAAHYPLRSDAREIYSSPWKGQEGQAAFYRQIAQANTDNISEVQGLYRKCDFPVHLIWGELDTFIPIDQGRELLGLLQADSMVTISDAAHLVHEDSPDALLGALLQHL